MRIRYIERLAELLSFLLLTGIFYYYNTYMTVGGFGVGYQYILCLLMCTMCAGLFLIFPDPAYFYHSAKAAGVLACSYFAAMLYSAAIWIFSFTPVRQMISGFFEPGYMILCILCAAMAAYVLREKMLVYAFWALTAAFALLLFPKLRAYGAAGFIRRLFEYVSSGGRTFTGASLEDTSYSYTYVFFCLYFLFHRGEEAPWRRLLRFAVIAFAMLDIFKRSALLALAVGFAAAFVYARLGERSRRWLVNSLIVAFLIFTFLYIPFVRYGLFSRIADALQINTSARDRIYRYYERYYDFTPTYLGRGLGWVHRLVTSADRFNVGLASVNVHCDYVRHYIELGFWGYLLWILSVFPWTVKRLIRGNSALDDAVILGVCVALTVFRLTENISYLYSAALGMSIVLIQCVMNGKKG